MFSNTSLYSYLCGAGPEVILEDGWTGWTQHSPVSDNLLVFNSPKNTYDKNPQLPSVSGLLVIQQCIGFPDRLAAKYTVKNSFSGIQINGDIYPVRFTSLLLDDTAPNQLTLLNESEECVDYDMSASDLSCIRTLFLTAVAEKYHRIQARTLLD
jgi:hypothetical protein